MKCKSADSNARFGGHLKQTKENEMSDLPAIFEMPEAEVMAVMRNSLYPGAQDESIKMVLGYCRAAGLDPMHKPVHIVPMWDKNTKTMRDVIMPGIGSYRTQAARSGDYAGVSEPEFGDDVTVTLDGVQVTYPAWCRVTVRRLMRNGQVAEFSAVERWTENYATQKRDSLAPNAMWLKRPYAQLAKCAEAQALRKAFPEFGSQPTSDEMAGKELVEFDGTRDKQVAQQKPEPKVIPAYPDDKNAANAEAWVSAIKSGKTTAESIIAKIGSAYALDDDQIEAIRAIEAHAKGEQA